MRPQWSYEGWSGTFWKLCPGSGSSLDKVSSILIVGFSLYKFFLTVSIEEKSLYFINITLQTGPLYKLFEKDQQKKITSIFLLFNFKLDPKFAHLFECAYPLVCQVHDLHFYPPK